MKTFCGNSVFLPFIFLVLVCVTLAADHPESLEVKMRAAEETIWTRFYSPETNLFYDYLTSYETGKELAHLPQRDEVRRQYPNPCGYGTGMEDCMISAGVMMTAVLSRYRCESYEEGPARAEMIFRGIERSIESVPGEGFVARGRSPFAPELFYINSSRDQVTHAVAAMWEYYRSGLPSEEINKRIRKCVKEVADRMFRNVTAENNYDFLCADGSPCRYGICKMENVMPHEAARLAMIYAVAWDVTGEDQYFRLWRQKIRAAAEGSRDPNPSTATYGLLQMQESLAILSELEPEDPIRGILLEAAQDASLLAASRISRLTGLENQIDLTAVAPHWREAGGLVDPYRSVWYYPRERGEIILTLLKDPNKRLYPELESFLTRSVEIVDFSRNSSCGVFDLLASWWMWKAAAFHK